MENSDVDSDSELGFLNLDLGGVDFDQPEQLDSPVLGDADTYALELELDTVANQWKADPSSATNTRAVPSDAAGLAEVSSQLTQGKYADILRGEFASLLFGRSHDDDDLSFWNMVRKGLALNCHSVLDCVQAEMVGIAAFNIFQQVNYTGPIIDIQAVANDVNPHQCFRKKMQAVDQDDAVSQSVTEKRHTHYHNSVLAELACDGQWPCQVA